MNHDLAAVYLAAFIDGEGHVSCTATARGKFTKQIAFSNTDKQLFDRVIELAASIGLRFRVYYIKSQRKEWSDKWLAYLGGGKAAFERFAAIVPLQCEKKKQKVCDLLNSYMDMEAVYAKQRTSILKNCPICDNEFYAFPSDIKRGQGKFCSPKCGFASRKRQHSKNCVTCGSLFYVPTFRRQKAKFCSMSCQGKAQADRMRGLAKKAAMTRWANHVPS